MATILIYTAPCRGSLYPLVPALDILLENGHQIHAVVPESDTSVLSMMGIHATPLADVVECADYLDYKSTNHAESIQIALSDRIKRGYLEAEDLAIWANKIKPDLMLVDAHSFGATAWAENSGIEWASWSTRLLPFPSSNIPPFSLGLPLKKGAFGALKNMMKKGSIQRVYDSVLEQLNDMRSSQGADPLKSVMDWPANLKNLLYFTAEPFEYEREWPRNVRLVGPGNWEPFMEKVRLDDDERPIVLISCCCDFQDERSMVQTALDNLPSDKYQIVVTTAAVDPQAFGDYPNVKMVRFSAHMPILERASCVICSGGLGLVQKALCYGVPVLAIPYGRDQVEIGQRLKHLKAGTSLHSTQLSASSFKDSFNVAISCRHYAEEMKEIFSNYDSAKTVSYVIEHILVPD